LRERGGTFPKNACRSYKKRVGKRREGKRRSGLMKNVAKGREFVEPTDGPTS